MELSADAIDRWARLALDEDLAGGVAGGDAAALPDAGRDVTTASAVPRGTAAEARILARGPGVLAGMAVAKRCFALLDPRVRFGDERVDGDRLSAGEAVMRISGDAGALLAAERSALNYLQRLSGIATRTAAFVAAVVGTGARILHTRKTTPGLRGLELAAVRAGGGEAHRVGLFDQVLLKENHFALARAGYEDTVRAAVGASNRPVIAEARNLEEARAAVRGGAAVVMLDNLGPGQGLGEAIGAIRELACQLGSQVEIEASGGVNLGNVRAYADAGVDRISVGALTHSVPALDLSLLMSGAGPA